MPESTLKETDPELIEFFYGWAFGEVPNYGVLAYLWSSLDFRPLLVAA